ncbi:hypothetical protein ES705_31350 [subsurface metagenome]
MITCLTFKDYVDIAQIITGFAAIAALIFFVVGFRKNNRISKSTFLLELRDKFQEDKRYKIHIALKNGEKIENWTDLDDYLGLFEVCEIMIRNKSIELHDFKKLYGYRLQNILSNDKVVYFKLILEFKYWDNLYNLLERCFDKHTKEFDDLKKISLSLEDRDRRISDVKRFLKMMKKISKIQ